MVGSDFQETVQPLQISKTDVKMNMMMVTMTMITSISFDTSSDILVLTTPSRPVFVLQNMN